MIIHILLSSQHSLEQILFVLGSACGHNGFASFLAIHVPIEIKLEDSLMDTSHQTSEQSDMSYWQECVHAMQDVTTFTPSVVEHTFLENTCSWFFDTHGLQKPQTNINTELML